MKKIISLPLVTILLSSVVFSQALLNFGFQNTLWTGFGQQNPEWIQNENVHDYPNVRLYGLYETLQARIDIAQFTVEGMLNWAAETHWTNNNFVNITFTNTKRTPFYYTNNSNQGGGHTSGETDSYYVNFIWNVLNQNKHDLDFGIGTQLAWKIGPAPSFNGYYWEPYTHIIQGGLKEGAPGSADVVGYTHYDNVYSNHALGIRYSYDKFIQIGVSLPNGVSTNQFFVNAALAIQPVDFLRASIVFENVGKRATDLYTNLSLFFSEFVFDAYLEVQDLGNSERDKTWGTGATITWRPVKNFLIKPEGGITFYKQSNYTPAFYFGGRLEWSITNTIIFGGFSSLGFGSKNTNWINNEETVRWIGGHVFDVRPDISFVLDKYNTISAAFDYQFRNAFNNDKYSVWATGIYWTYKR